MKMLLFLTLFTFISMTVTAQNTPIIDRDLFFGNPEISGGQLSPDGKWVSFMKEYEGIMNIWVKKIDDSFDKARPLTDSKQPMYGYFWSEDSKYILYVKDQEGDENINVFVVDPMAKVSKGVPTSRNLTPLKDVAAQIVMVSKKDPDLLMVALNDRDKAWHDLYALKITTGELTLLYENNDRITDYNFDWDENLKVLCKTDHNGTTEFLYKDGDKLTPIYSTLVTETAYIASWNEDNTKFYLVTNKGELNLSTLFLMNPQTKKLDKIESDPKGKVDFGGLTMDRNTRKIISTSYTADKTDIYWKDKTWEANYKYLQKKFPGREVDFSSATHDYTKFLITVWGDKFASDIYYFDAKSKELVFQYTPRPALKNVEKYLSGMNPISYKSSDGLEIPAYLTIPTGSKGKNLPVVVLVHGGPKGPRDYWGYNSYAQFLANRGYAVLQPNFRASGGYGKNFQNAGDLQWGKLMQDDVTWGVKYLISQGIADPTRIAIMGGSYGGYATLAGLAFTPDVYACGVDIVGPSNIFTLLESVPAYWEAGRAFLYGMVGDPNTEEGKKRIKEASPLFSVDRIIKPLLIIQGANDPRVKQAEADQIVIALRNKNKKVNYLLAKDEGHGFAKPLNRMAMFAEVEKFLSETIGGRYQDDMTDEVRKTLEGLRVDVNTVTYKPKGELKVAKSLPASNPNWKEGQTEYDVKLEVAGQIIPMEMTRTVSKSGADWIIKEVSKGAMGTMTDEVIFTEHVKPKARELSQLGQAISISFDNNQAIVELQDQKLPIEFDGAYLPECPGLDIIIGGFDLNPDFSLAFSMPDIMTMKPKQVILTVKDDGIYNIVEVVNHENENEITTYFINKSSKVADKIIQVMPAMQNAVMTITKK